MESIPGQQQALLPTSADASELSSTTDHQSSSSCVGLGCVTGSALVFGGVAALVKVTALSPLVMLEARGALQWLLALAAALYCLRDNTLDVKLFGRRSVRCEHQCDSDSAP